MKNYSLNLTNRLDVLLSWFQMTSMHSVNRLLLPCSNNYHSNSKWILQISIMHSKLHDLAKKKSAHIVQLQEDVIHFFLENYGKAVIESQYQICVLFRPRQMFDFIGKYVSCSTVALKFPPKVGCCKYDACTLPELSTAYRVTFLSHYL